MLLWVLSGICSAASVGWAPRVLWRKDRPWAQGHRTLEAFAIEPHSESPLMAAFLGSLTGILQPCASPVEPGVLRVWDWQCKRSSVSWCS